MAPQRTQPVDRRRQPTDPASVVILGATGSIGRQALEVAAAMPG